MRKFIQPVAMRVSPEDKIGALLDSLHELGYRGEPTDNFVSHPHLVNHFMGECGLIDNVIPYAKAYDGRIVIENFNPDLFLALAACSEGDEFYNGEWVVMIDDEELDNMKNGSMFHVKKVDLNHLVLNTEKENILIKDRFRKATAEEIIKHLSKEVEEKPKAVEKPRDDRGDMVGWVPKVDEEIWVWNEGSKRRIKQRFGFFSTNNRVMAYEAPTSMDEDNFWGSVVCKKFDHFAKIDAPVRVPVEYAKNLIALELGVPAELIQIDR